MAIFKSETLPTARLCAAMLLSCAVLLSGCRNAAVPGPQQTIPGTNPAVQTAPTPVESQGADNSPTPDVTEEPTVFADVLEFPVSLEQDQLFLQTPFSYDGLNPDCDNAEGSNIAAITVMNCSDRHLVQAELTLILADGTQIPFRIEHIPSGKKVTAFALDNARISSEAQWTQVLVSADFTGETSLREQGLSIQENGTHIDLSNETGAELTNLMIYCHNLLGEEYFGGKAYSYKVNNIPTGAAASVDALDCILGIAEVTYAVGNQE